MSYTLLKNSDPYLFEKYDVYAYDYIEYPHKSYWSEEFTDADYRAGLKELLLSDENHPLVLYVHIPFCPQMCYFCLCHFKITHNYEKIKNYLNYLYKEIDILKDFFDEHSIVPNFRELHLGGGSPTYVQEAEFIEL